MSKLKLPDATAQTIPLAKLRPSPTNPRKSFPDGPLQELAASIRQHGLLQPILVRPVEFKQTVQKKLTKAVTISEVVGREPGFEIVAGERRLRAAKLAGLKEVPCQVRALADAEVLELQLVENDQREDVKPTEQAAAYKRLADAVGQAAAAERTGRSESAIRGWCLLAKCPPELAAAVDAGTVGRSVAELVCRVGGEQARDRAAGCVVLGELFPAVLEDDWRDTRTMLDKPPLTFRETKELIARHFQKELKAAPFPTKKPLDLLPSVPSCDACPKRAGNLAKLDPEFAGVRADTCTDPDCFELKVRMYRQHECERFAKRQGIIGPIEPVEGWQGDKPPKGYCVIDGKANESELGGGWKDDALVYELDARAEAHVPRHQAARLLSFDAKGKPRTLVRTADVRKRLVAAGLMGRPAKAEKNVGTRAVGAQASAAGGSGEIDKLYRITAEGKPYHHVEFAAAVDATEEEVAYQAFLAMVEYLSYGWEEVPPGEERDLKPVSCRVCGCTDDNCSQCVAKTGEPCSWVEPNLCSACVPAAEVLLADLPRFPEEVRAALDRKGVRTVARLLEIAAPDADTVRTDLFAFLQKLPGVGKGPAATAADAIADREILPPAPQAPAPGPVVCRPLGDLTLGGVAGVTPADLELLGVAGIRTLGELQRRCEALEPDDRPQKVEGQIYAVLRTYKGIFSDADCERLTDAVVAHLTLAKPEAAAASPPLSAVRGLSAGDVDALAGLGLATLADVARVCEAARVAKRLPASVADPKIDSNIYAHLRDKFGEHPKLLAVVNRIGDALLDHVGHEEARKQLADQPQPTAKSKGRRKAVSA